MVRWGKQEEANRKSQSGQESRKKKNPEAIMSRASDGMKYFKKDEVVNHQDCLKVSRKMSQTPPGIVTLSTASCYLDPILLC